MKSIFSPYYNPDQGFGGAPQQQPAYNYNNGPYQNAPYQNAPNIKIKPTPPLQEPPTYNQAAYGFDEAFKIEKPKFNDLRAGILVRLSFYLLGG